MGKLRNFSFKELARLLESEGFELKRVHGSHHIYRGFVGGRNRTVPLPKGKEIPVGTLKSIIRQSGLDQSLFEIDN